MTLFAVPAFVLLTAASWLAADGVLAAWSALRSPIPDHPALPWIARAAALALHLIPAAAIASRRAPLLAAASFFLLTSLAADGIRSANPILHAAALEALYFATLRATLLETCADRLARWRIAYTRVRLEFEAGPYWFRWVARCMEPAAVPAATFAWHKTNRLLSNLRQPGPDRRTGAKATRADLARVDEYLRAAVLELIAKAETLGFANSAHIEQDAARLSASLATFCATLALPADERQRVIAAGQSLLNEVAAEFATAQSDPRRKAA